MLKLEIGVGAIDAQMKKIALDHVIRHGKRWGRYQLNLPKDIRRIQRLMWRSRDNWGLVITGSGEGAVTPASVAGWDGQQVKDLFAVAGNDFLEVIALMEYWSLWQYSKEILALPQGK